MQEIEKPSNFALTKNISLLKTSITLLTKKPLEVRNEQNK